MADFEEARAKVNLFLEVIRKREDGYHDIGTLFQTVGLCDRLEAELREDGEIRFETDRPMTEKPEQDLVWRAAEALRERAGGRGKVPGATLRLTKTLPAGAGLGGGSADAAAALRLLNRLWGLGLNAAELERTGRALGADVPFLVRGGTALAGGIGDELDFDVPPPPDCALLVVTPNDSVPTAKAYAGVRPAGAGRWEAFRELWKRRPVTPEMAGHLLHNGFQPGVFAQYPGIAQTAAELAETGALGVLLSGSGASVFALYSAPEEAEAALENLQTPHRFAATTRFTSSLLP